MVVMAKLVKKSLLHIYVIVIFFKKNVPNDEMLITIV